MENIIGDLRYKFKYNPGVNGLRYHKYENFAARPDKRQTSMLKFCEAKKSKVPYQFNSTKRKIAAAIIKMVIECSLTITFVEQPSFCSLIGRGSQKLSEDGLVLLSKDSRQQDVKAYAT